MDQQPPLPPPPENQDDEVKTWPLFETSITTSRPIVFPTIKTSVEYSIVKPDGETPFDGDEWRDALRKTAAEFQRRLDGQVIAGAPPFVPAFAIKREFKFEVPPDLIDELNRQIMNQLLFNPNRWRQRGGIYGDDGRLHYSVTIPPIR